MGIDWGRLRDNPMFSHMGSDDCAIYYGNDGQIDNDRFTRDQLRAARESVGSFAAKVNFETSSISTSDAAMYAMCGITALGAIVLVTKALRKNQVIFAEDKNSYFTVESEPSSTV